MRCPYHWRSAASLVAVVGACVALVSPLHGAVRPPKFDYHISTLDNGLTVVLSEDHSTPIAHVELWYRVGSKNERPGTNRVRALVRALDVQGLEERPVG